nr:hypothetical protein [uncultured Desulfobacter sp.]
MNLRKLGLILTCLMLLIGIGTAAHASEVDQGAQPLGKMQTFFKSNHFGKDWGFGLGVKTWTNDWSLPLEVKSSPTATTTTSIVQFDSDMEVAFIPTGLVRYKNFFIGGGYMPGTDYDFNQQTVNETTISQVNGERKEWDLNIGYFLTPNLAVTLGYKKIERELTLRDEGISKNVSYPLSAHAPIIGVATSLPINEKFSFYGNFAYGFLGGDSQYIVSGDSPNSMDLDGNYYLAELGFNYVIPIKTVVSGMTISLGYRFQRLDMEMTDTVGGAWNGSAGNQNDTTSGITFSVSASF